MGDLFAEKPPMNFPIASVFFPNMGVFLWAHHCYESIMVSGWSNSLVASVSARFGGSYTSAMINWKPLCGHSSSAYGQIFFIYSSMDRKLSTQSSTNEWHNYSIAPWWFFNPHKHISTVCSVYNHYGKYTYTCYAYEYVLFLMLLPSFARKWEMMRDGIYIMYIISIQM